jgi:hypothetical protein
MSKLIYHKTISVKGRVDIYRVWRLVLAARWSRLWVCFLYDSPTFECTIANLGPFHSPPGTAPYKKFWVLSSIQYDTRFSFRKMQWVKGYV